MSKVKIEDIIENKLNVDKKVPIRKWSKTWPLPDKLRLEKYTVKMISSGKESLVERWRLVGRMGTEVPKAKKWYKGNENRAGLDYFVENGYVWCILRNSFPTNITLDNCKVVKDNNWLYLTVPDNYVGAWYYERLNDVNFAIIPEYIELNDLFWQTMGILFGEMRREGTIEITNNEPLVINTLIEWFNKTKIIPKDEWTFSVNINCKNLPQGDRNKTIGDSKLFWSQKINIPIKRIISVHFYEQFNSTATPNLGIFKVAFTHEPIRKIIDLLFDFAKITVTKSEKFAIPFLQGLFAGEGGVNINEGRVAELRIASKYLEERRFYERICKTAQIDAKASIKTHQVIITGLWNILRCLEIDMAKLHEMRKDKLIRNLNNMQTMKAMATLSNNPLTVTQIKEKLGITDYININKNFHNLFVHSFIDRTKNSETYTYHLTERGKVILSSLSHSQLAKIL